MQTETPEAAVVSLKLSRLADDINNEYKAACAIAREAESSGVAAIKAAVRAGSYIRKAKGICKGTFAKWLSDNCPDISESTAQRWMRLSTNASHVTDAKTLRQAYIAIGIIKEPAKALKPMGTAPVDIFGQLCERLDKAMPVFDLTEGMEVEEIPQDMRHRLLEKAKPVVEFVEKLKALEVA